MIHLYGGGQGSAGLLPLTSRDVQGAEPPVAVGLERTHAQLLGQGESLAVVGFGRRSIGGLALGRNVAEEVHGTRLKNSSLAGAGTFEDTLGEHARLLEAAGVQMCLTQTQAQKAWTSAKLGSELNRPFEEQHSIIDTP